MILFEFTSFLKDYSDYIVLIPSVFLGGIIAYWLYLKQKNVKELVYEKVSLNNIVKIDNKFRNSIEVKFNGKNVDNLWLLIIKFINSGNTPIEKKDFDTPLYLELNSGNQILDAEVINTYPSNLKLETTHTAEKVELSPSLLNPGDNYSIRVMISGTEPKYSINARISGVKNLFERNPDKQSSNSSSQFFASISIWVVMITVILIVFMFRYSNYQKIFATPEVEILNQNLYKLDGEMLGNIELIPRNPSASKENLIYYKINTNDELFRAVNINGQWSINIEQYKEFLVNGKNEVCYKFKDEGKEYKCLIFNIIPKEKK